MSLFCHLSGNDFASEKLLRRHVQRIHDKSVFKCEEYEPTGQKRILILAKADDIPENIFNIEILLSSLNLLEVCHDFQMVCDLKLTNMTQIHQKKSLIV